MEERVQISMLLDLYGELLTSKQKDIMNFYFNEDLSLAEISEINHTSRQAIYDILKRCQKLLLDYDSKLKLLEKDKIIQELKKDMETKLDSLKNEIIIDKKIKVIEDIKSIIKNI
ncbi:MAG: putative DNA-binding protein [Clostridium sp.]|uniref:putative DNA-binding protein n=1 Tax=Clostridium sp. TaxID=1506 RepID=UPI0039EB4D38